VQQRSGTRSLDQPSSPSPVAHIVREVPALVSLAVPVVAGLIGATSLDTVTSYMLGPLGEVPLAACSLTLSVLVIFYAGVYGLMSAVGLMTGKAYGAGNQAEIASILRHGLAIGVAGGIVAAILMALGLLVLPYTGQPPEVLAVIAPYWLAMSALLLPFMLSIAIKQFLDSIDRPWTGALLATIPLMVDIPLSWSLIYGKLGLPALGLLGAGVSHVTSYLAGVACMLLYIGFASSMAPYCGALAFRRPAFLAQLREGAPMSFQYFLEGGAVAVVGVLMGWLGATALAANQIAFSVGGIIYMAPLGLAAAVGIRIAQAIGEGAVDRVRAIGLAGIGVTMVWMLVCGVILVVAGREIADIFVDEAPVIATTASVFLTFAFMQLFDGLQSVSLGALRGMLDNRWPTRVSLVAYWLIALPLSILFGFTFGFGVVGVWAGFGVGIAVAGCALLWRFMARTAALQS